MTHISQTPENLHMKDLLGGIAKAIAELPIFVSEDVGKAKLSVCEVCELAFFHDLSDEALICPPCAALEEEEGDILDEGDGTYQTFFTPWLN